MGKLHVIDHPLVQHKLSLMRDKTTGTKDFRELLQEVATLMAYEVTRDLPLKEIEIETPIGPCRTKIIDGRMLGIIPILRAGLGMVDGIMQLVPGAKVGHIGLYRDPVSLQPVEYYCKLPEDIGERDVLIVDPMLATGGSAAAAVQFLRDRGAHEINLLVLLAAPEGIEEINRTCKDVTIYTCAIDSHLNDHGYIVPGLGDAGDRLFGTK